MANSLKYSHQGTTMITYSIHVYKNYHVYIVKFNYYKTKINETKNDYKHLYKITECLLGFTSIPSLPDLSDNIVWGNLADFTK